MNASGFEFVRVEMRRKSTAVRKSGPVEPSGDEASVDDAQDGEDAGARDRLRVAHKKAAPLAAPHQRLLGIGPGSSGEGGCLNVCVCVCVCVYVRLGGWRPLLTC